MTKIVSIVPTVPTFSITWMIGSRCNYDCMYCRPFLHDLTSQPHSLELMQKAWQSIHEKTKHLGLLYKISFTGGEVTSSKSFLPLVRWLRETYPDIQHVHVSSNGSASTRYYKELGRLIESMSFSTHSEFIDEQKFFTTVEAINQLMVRPKKSFHLDIMNEYWNENRIQLYKSWAEERDISYSVNEINYGYATRDTNIQKGKTNFNFPILALKKSNTKKSNTLETLSDLRDHFDYNIKVTTDSGTQYKIFANWLHNNQFDHWKGWVCSAGATRLYVDKDFRVFGGECKNDQLGSVFDFQLLTNTVCKRDRCTGCTDDLMVAKQESKS